MGWFCPFVCVSFPVGQPDPNANPDPPTSADREVPIHGWRLVVAPCGLVMCAWRVLGFQGAISLVSWLCFAARFSICSPTGTYTRIYKFVCISHRDFYHTLSGMVRSINNIFQDNTEQYVMLCCRCQKVKFSMPYSPERNGRTVDSLDVHTATIILQH